MQKLQARVGQLKQALACERDLEQARAHRAAKAREQNERQRWREEADAAWAAIEKERKLAHELHSWLAQGSKLRQKLSAAMAVAREAVVRAAPNASRAFAQQPRIFHGEQLMQEVWWAVASMGWTASAQVPRVCGPDEVKKHFERLMAAQERELELEGFNRPAKPNGAALRPVQPSTAADNAAIPADPVPQQTAAEVETQATSEPAVPVEADTPAADANGVVVCVQPDTDSIDSETRAELPADTPAPAAEAPVAAQVAAEAGDA